MSYSEKNDPINDVRTKLVFKIEHEQDCTEDVDQTELIDNSVGACGG